MFNFKNIVLVIALLIIVSFLQCGMGGGGSGGDGSSGNQSSSSEKDSNNKIANPILENTTPFGLSTFAMGVPTFPLEDSQVAEGIGYKSVAQVVRHIATNELYTFPETPDHSQIINTLQEFIANGHLVTHEIHILNGPSMRKSRDAWINNVVGRAIDDQQFVNMLQNNSTVRSAVQNLFNEVVQYAKVLEGVGVEVLICPELEDNETHNTFKILIDMLNNAGWTDSSKIVRNGGTPGEFGNVRYESHNIFNINLRQGDIFNNDGNTFNLSSKANPQPGALSEDQIRYAINTTQSRGILMFIWSAHLQGNQQVSPGNFTPYPSYTNRHYVLDDPVGQAAILLGINSSEVILQ